MESPHTPRVNWPCDVVRDRPRPGGAAQGRGVALPDPHPRLPVLRQERALRQRRRVRRADAPPAGHRGALPGADHAGLAHPARRRARGRGVRRRRAPGADAVAGQRLQVQRAGGLVPARGSAGGHGQVPLRLRAQDRRAGRGARLRERPLRAGRDARRRPPRREHHREPEDDPQHPDAGARQGPSGALRGARRGLHAESGLRAAERRALRTRRAALRQPPQRRGRRRPPARPEDDGQAPAGHLDLPARLGGRRRRPAHALGHAALAERARLPHQPRDRALRQP